MLELIEQIPIFGGFLATLIPFVFVLAVVVAVHEYGHYIVGRWCGIHAEVFSLGFGRVLWSRVDRRGTRWQLAALPLGGYVKFLGDADAASRTDHAQVEAMDEATRARSFPGAALWKRFLTVLAGPMFNFFLSVVLTAALLMWQGVADKPVIEKIAAMPGATLPFEDGDRIVSINGTPVEYFADIRDLTAAADPAEPMQIALLRAGEELSVSAPYLLLPIVGDLVPLSPAAKAGLKRGDFIYSAAGQQLKTFLDLQAVMNAYTSGPIDLQVWRDGILYTLEITPEKSVRETADGGFEERVMIGIVAGFAFQPVRESIAPWTAVSYGVRNVFAVIGSSLNAIKHIVTGQIGADNLQGPLGIAQVSGEVASNGIVDLIGLIAFVSTAIGMLNLFPVPVLDGGHLVIFGYEALRGRPPSRRALEIGMSIGLAMVLLLMLFATYNDIMRL
jgi:regulator of sigma E protease